MPRSVIEEEYAVKRNEILDVAQRLVGTQGYSQVSIQDILNDLQISKGAFYHYFDSKQALLEALVDRIQEEIVAALAPVIHDPALSALVKLQRFFDAAASWKIARKEFLLALVRVWYADENALFRLKMQSAMIKQTSFLLTEIVAQGIREGCFATPYPDLAGEVVLSLILGLGEATLNLILSGQPVPDALQRLERTLAAYTHALERVLGAPNGSLHLIDTATLKEWVS